MQPPSDRADGVSPPDGQGAEILAGSAAPASGSANGQQSLPVKYVFPPGTYLPPAGLPTQQAPDGVRFDFNEGARVLLPRRQSGAWRARLSDLDTGNVLFETESDAWQEDVVVQSSKRFFIRFRVEVWDIGTDGQVTAILDHEYDAFGQNVIIMFPGGTLGDALGWLPYAARFWQVHGCRLTCVMVPALIDLLRPGYPKINFVTMEQATQARLAETAYATYAMGLFFHDRECVLQPVDFRHVGLHRTVGHILGVDPREDPCRLVLADDTPPIANPYVCIAVQASSQAKKWNNPFGWEAVIAFLKQRGFRVVCIDQRRVHGDGLVWTHIPHGAEDETGSRPLAERVRWLRHAAAFIGLSSGLAWLAWSAGAPVVLISGFTLPDNEFFTPYRIINWHTCNGCWHDIRYVFDHKDFLWCPRHANTPRQFECTRLITAEHVIQVLKRLPGIAAQPSNQGDLT